MKNPSAYTLSKHHALGNDFLVLDKSQAHTDQSWSRLARLWCDRRTGIGADGLLILEIRDRTHLSMELINADGSPAEMSGNGIRCLVQAAVQALTTRGEPGATGFDVETAAGTRRVDVVASDTPPDPQTMMCRVDMGVVTEVDPPANWSDLGCHEDRPVRHLSLGNPHAVVGVDDVHGVDLRTLGEKVPTVNLEIIEPGPETNGVTMRVHERGAGLTMACGTGACAAAEAALTWGLVPASASEVIVHMPGGDALVAVDRTTRRASLTGPVTFVATVSVPS